LETENQYLVPTGDGKSTIAIDLVEIVKAELRLQDVAIVNKFTAPELLSTYNDIWLKLNKSVTNLTYQKNKAKACHEDARANALLECTDEVLKRLGHTKGSADLREAVVQRAPEVQKTKDRLEEIGFVLETLRGKMQAFHNAYSSVKKLTDTKDLPGQKYGDANKPEPYTQQLPQIQDPDLQPLPTGFKGK
jgi:predicted nuclease with TOPRIM domain